MKARWIAPIDSKSTVVAKKAMQHDLLLAYVSFDETYIRSQLELAYHLNSSIHLAIPFVVRRIVRRYGLAQDQLTALCRDIQRKDIHMNITLVINLCQILKYAIREGAAVAIHQLMQWLDEFSDARIQHELIWALVFTMRNQHITELDEAHLIKIRRILTTLSHPAAAAFSIETVSYRSSASSCSYQSAVSLPKVEVVKELHTTKATQVHKKQAENISLDLKTLLDTLRGQHKHTQTRRQLGAIPTVSDSAGDDRTWHNGTLRDVISLYVRAKQQGILKQDDKDNYLREKFLSPDAKWFAEGEVGQFFIDRMICHIFFTLAKKQRLHKAVISKLMLCVDTLEHLKLSLFSVSDADSIARKLINEKICRQKYSSDPSIISDFASKLCMQGLQDLKLGGWFSSTTYTLKIGKIAELVDIELETMRIEALSALYDSVRRNSSILAEADVKKIQSRLRDTNRDVKKIAIQILSVLEDTPGINPSELLAAYLLQLESPDITEEETDVAIAYFLKQLNKEESAKHLFTEDILTRVIACITKASFHLSSRLGLFDIIFCYQASVRVLSQLQLQKIVELITSLGKEELIEECLTIILQYSDHTKALPPSVLKQLTLSAQLISSKASSLMVMVIANLGAAAFDYNLLAFKLTDESIIVQEGERIKFIARTKEHAAAPAVASVLAQSILQSLSLTRPSRASAQTIKQLVTALNLPDKTTKILCARVLFSLLEKKLLPALIDQTVLFDLQSVVQDSISDVSVYATLFFLESLRKHAQQISKIMNTHFSYLPKLYVLDRLIFSTSDFTDRVNNCLFDIWSLEARKGQTLTEDFFSLVDLVFMSINGQENASARKFLAILSDSILLAKRDVPERILHILENLLSTPGYCATAQSLLMGVIKNKQAVGEKTLTILKEQLFQPGNHEEARACLLLADSQQDLPDDVFSVVEMEKAIDCLERVITNESAWQMLEIATASGEKLTKNAIIFLSRVQSLSPQLLAIYKNMIANGQSLFASQVNSLFKYYQSNPSHRQFLLELFFGLEKNGQRLPEELLSYLESSLMDSTVLLLFLNKAQKGERISAPVIRKIVRLSMQGAWDRLGSQQDELSVKTALLNFIYVQAQKTEKPEVNYEIIFLRYLRDAHCKVVLLSLQGLTYIQEHDVLSRQAIDELCALLPNCLDQGIKDSVQAILAKTTLSGANQAIFELMTAADDLSDEDYLTLCEKHVHVMGLFTVNNNKIHHIIISKPILQVRALTLLVSCAQRFSLNLSSEQWIDLKKLSMSKQTTVCRLASILLPTVVKEEMPATFEKISSARVSFFAPLLSSEKESMLSAISAENMSDKTLTDYHRLLSLLSTAEVRAVGEKLTLLFSLSTQDEFFRLKLLRLIVLSSVYDPEFYQSFLENLLYHPDPAIRSQAFSGLMYLTEREGHSSSRFIEFCAALSDKLEPECGVRIEDVELLHVISSLRFFHMPVDMPEDTWIKCFILSDWAACWQLDDAEKYTLYEQWSLLAESLPHANYVLIQLHALSNLSWAQLNDILQNLEFTSAESLAELLQNPIVNYFSLRKHWLKQQLIQQTTIAITLVSDTLLSIDAVILDDLLQTMAQDLPPTIAEIWLSHFAHSHCIETMRNLLKLVRNHPQVDLYSLDFSKETTVEQLLMAVQLQVLSCQFTKLAEKDHLLLNLKKILLQGWQFEQLELLIQTAESRMAFFENNLLQCLTVLASYQVSPQHFHRILEIIAKQSPAQWLPSLNSLVIEENFCLTPIIKNSEQLIADLIKENEGNAWISAIRHTLLSDMQQIASRTLAVCTLSRTEILAWARATKSCADYFANPAHLVEALAIVDRAYFILTGFQLTNTQILSCLLALKTERGEKDSGCLLEVQTGEGKTAIISAITIIKVLQGQKVDVVTSSPVEAERCAREQFAFYQLFDISVADNLDRSPYIKGAKKCYSADVVYGEMSQFQFDALRDEYELLGTKGGRPYGEIVADEVDSMMIDEGTKIAKLSSTIAGMDQLREPYYYVTYQVKYLLNHIVDIDGELYYFEGKVTPEEGRLVLHYGDEEGLKKIDDLRAYIQSQDVSTVGGELITGDSTAYIEQAVTRHLDALIEKGLLHIPVHFRDFFAKQKSKWVKNTMAAHVEFTEKVHYIVQNHLVKPVAYTSNGVVQNSTQWNDGLHQALQIKEELVVSSESFTTNFISNVAYFDRYQGRICGLTGTLGTAIARENLMGMYQVQCADVPSMRQKQYKQLPTVIASNQQGWMQEIYLETVHEVKKGRGVLIICQTIDEVLSLEQFIKSNDRTALVKTYTLNGCDQEKAIERIHPAEIFIATSLGGRGMDIKADAVNRAGGMHVILASALDDRNSRQALARTSRQGRLGSGRKILNRQQLFAQGYRAEELTDIEKALKEREAEQLTTLFGKPLEVIALKDRLFKRFCVLLLSIRKDVQKKSRGVLRDVRDTVVSVFSDLNPSVYETRVVAAIEERWAMLLLNIEDGTLALESAEAEYAEFEIKIRAEYELKTLLQNPCHLITVGNECMTESHFDEAQKYFDRAIAKDKKVSAAAYVGRGWIYLKKRPADYKKLALDEFSIAVHLIYDELAHAQAIQTMMQQQQVHPHSPLMQQLTQKINLLGSYAKSIQSAIETIKRSQRLMTVTTTRRYQNTHTSRSDFKIDQISESRTQFEVARTTAGALPFTLSAAAKYDVHFNHLTEREDMGSIDQAVKTIEAAFAATKIEGIAEVPVLENYQGLSVELSSIDLAAVQDFLNPDIVRKNLSKTAALKELEARTSRTHKLTRGTFSSKKVSVEIFSDTGACNLKIMFSLPAEEDLFAHRNNYILVMPNVCMAGAGAAGLTSDIAPKLHYVKSDGTSERVNILDYSLFDNDPVKLLDRTTETTIKLTGEQVNRLIKLNGGHTRTTCLTHEKELSLLEAIELVKSTEESRTVTLRFLAANKTVNSLAVELLDLSSTEAQERLTNIHARLIDIELTGDAKQLVNIVEKNTALLKITLFQLEETHEIEKDLYREALLKQLHARQNQETTIKIKALTPERAQSVLQFCEGVRINLHAKQICVAESLLGLEEGLANVQFTQLNIDLSRQLIARLRKENIEFVTTFLQLTSDQIETVVRGANLAQEKIEISRVKPLATLFLDHDRPETDLAELAARGIEHLLELSERKFIPWRSVLTVTLLAGIQIAAGAALVVSGFGATVGMGLITEGVADLVTACRAGISRQFSWNDYCKQKAVSLIISAACMGLQAIKSAGRGVSTMVSAASEEALQRAGQGLITNGRAAGQQLVQTTQQLRVLVTKHIGVSVVEAGAREVLNHAVDSLSHVAFEQFKPQISSSIREKVDIKFCDTRLRHLISKLYVLDELQQSTRYTQRIDHLVREILNPTHSFWRKQWDSVGLPLVRGLLSAPDKLRTPFSVGFRVIGILNGMYEIVSVLDRFHEELYKQVMTIDTELASIPKMLQQFCNLTAEESLSIADLLTRHHVVRDQQIIACDKLSIIDFRTHTAHKIKVVKFLQKIEQKMKIAEVRPLTSMIANLMTDQIIQTAESQLVMPLTSYAVGEGVSFASSHIQQAIIRAETKKKVTKLKAKLESLEGNDTAQAHNDRIAAQADLDKYQELLTKDQLKASIQDMETAAGALTAKKDKSKAELKRLKELRGDVTSARASVHQRMTFASECHRVAAEKVVAHSQCSMMLFGAKKETGKKRLSTKARKEVADCAAKISTDASANLLVMVKMAADNDISLKVVDANYRPTEQNIKNNTQFAVFIPGKRTADGTAGVGHWCTMNHSGQLIPVPSEGNDCGYAVMSHLISQAGKGEKSVAQLRHETAASIETSTTFYYGIEAQNWLRSHNPKAANDLLFNGGKIIFEMPESYKLDLIDFTQNEHLTNLMKKLFGEDFNDSGKKAEFRALFEKFMAQDEMQSQSSLESYLSHLNDESGAGQVASSECIEGPGRITSGPAVDEKGEVISTGPRSDNPCGKIVVQKGAKFVIQHSSAKDIDLEGNDTSVVAMHKIYNLCQRLCICSNEQERAYLQKIIPQLVELKKIADSRQEIFNDAFQKVVQSKVGEDIFKKYEADPNKFDELSQETQQKIINELTEVTPSSHEFKKPIRHYANTIAAQISMTTQTGVCSILPTGYVGHAIYITCTKMKDGHIKVCVFNGGGGCDYGHAYDVETGADGKERLSHVYSYNMMLKPDELGGYIAGVLEAQHEKDIIEKDGEIYLGPALPKIYIHGESPSRVGGYSPQAVGNCSFYNMQLALSAGQDKEMMRNLLSFEEQVTLNLRAHISGQSGTTRRLKR